MGDKLIVYAEIESAYIKVGKIEGSSTGACFTYDDSFLAHKNAHSISGCLPLQTNTFNETSTQAFFDGLLPEGSMRRVFHEAFHSNDETYLNLLGKLNDESTGALIFEREGFDFLDMRGYDPIDFEKLVSFANSPRSVALSMNTASRLSLAGAQVKIGLLHKGSNMESGWKLPKGSAPSTHIIKATDGTFQGQTVNEALCMETAKNLGFEAAKCDLIRVDDNEPLLAIRRFDRIFEDDDMFPHRLHQEDFCQALGLASLWKYEPTLGNYVGKCGEVIAHESSNPFGDRVLEFSRILLDWAIGNCDNHLKNHSILWSSDWSSKALSPLYDITCTTIYPELDREMGVSLCASRKIDDVTLTDILSSAKSIGIPEKIAKGELEELLDTFLSALNVAENDIASQGFNEVSALAKHIESDFIKRRNKLS